MSWTCPYCGQPQPITPPMFAKPNGNLAIPSKLGTIGYNMHAIACANQDCKEVTLTVYFGAGRWKSQTGGTPVFTLDAPSECFRLKPASFAKPQPDSVPAILADDYYEACAIRDLSPKASATLSRRVLQGMIRDFCKIAKGTLKDEIDSLRKLADAGAAPQGVALETIDAMDHIRSIGNIGAHMEKDINVVVDVDPGEAQALIELIEMLFKDWYVAKAQRERRLSDIKKIAEEKKSIKQAKSAGDSA